MSEYSIRSLHVSPAELMEALSGGQTRKRAQRYGNLIEALSEPSAGILCVWNESECRNAPDLIIPQGSLEDFFAWSTVYLASLLPLTGFCRVLTREQVLHNLRGDAPVNTGLNRHLTASGSADSSVTESLRGQLVLSSASSDISSRRLLALASASVGSMWAEMKLTGEQRYCLTYSYYRARCHALGYSSLFDVAESRRRALRLLGGSSVQPGFVDNVWDLLGARGDSPLVLAASSVLDSGGLVEPDVLLAMGVSPATLLKLNAVLKTPLEDRVRLVVDVVLPSARRLKAEYAGFFAAYAMSIISEGRFLFAEVPQGASAGLAASVLYWFGFIEGARSAQAPRFRPREIAQMVLAMDVARKVDLFSSRRAQISLSEAEVIFRNGNLPDTLSLRPFSDIEMEIAPGVNVVFQHATLDSAPDRGERQRDALRKLETVMAVLEGLLKDFRR